MQSSIFPDAPCAAIGQRDYQVSSLEYTCSFPFSRDASGLIAHNITLNVEEANVFKFTRA